MRISRLFGKTLHEIPADVETISHQLLLKAGMIHQIASGIYSYLPLAWRVITKIKNIIREEMNNAGGQELMMPALQPAELWYESGRDVSFGKGLFTLTDRRQHQLVLGPTHEEVITKLVQHNVQSYRDLPLLLYQIQTKFRDEPRPRSGLIRIREFDMKDLYSFDIDDQGLDTSYNKMLKAYQNIYQRCRLPTILVEADSGAIGGKDSHEFMVAAETGEDKILSCTTCNYAANLEKAQSIKGSIPNNPPLPVEEVATPGAETIDEVSDFLKIPKGQTLKAVFYIADDDIIFVIIRGDIEVNEIKLKNTIRANELRMASEEEVIKAGIVAGSASPVGISNFKVIADESISSGTNFVAGANKTGYHLKNVNFPRDFKVDLIADIASAKAGEECPKCGGLLITANGIEVGHIFKLGTFLSETLGAHFTDTDGTARSIVMGCYGIGVGRLLAAVIEQSHDNKGIIWPVPIAPYHIYLCPLFIDDPNVMTAAEKLYTELMAHDIEVLFDDRIESPGVKFNDADLLGIPFRVTISPRTIRENRVEIKKRSEKEADLIPATEAIVRLKKLISKGLNS